MDDKIPKKWCLNVRILCLDVPFFVCLFESQIQMNCLTSTYALKSAFTRRKRATLNCRLRFENKTTNYFFSFNRWLHDLADGVASFQQP